MIATGRIMATVIPGSIQSNRDRAELVALRRLGTVEECANVVEVPRDSENERAAQYFIASRSKGFVAFLVLAVTEAERQATEGNEKVDHFKRAALTAVTFKR